MANCIHCDAELCAEAGDYDEICACCYDELMELAQEPWVCICGQPTCDGTCEKQAELQRMARLERPEFPDGEFPDPRRWTDPAWGTY